MVKEGPMDHPIFQVITSTPGLFLSPCFALHTLPSQVPLSSEVLTSFYCRQGALSKAEKVSRQRTNVSWAKLVIQEKQNLFALWCRRGEGKHLSASLLHFHRFLLRWLKSLKAEILSFMSHPKSVGKISSETEGSSPEFHNGFWLKQNQGVLTSATSIFPLGAGLFLATVWTLLGWDGGVFWMVAVAVLPKMSRTRIACSPKYKWSLSSKSYKSSFACGAHARWKVPLWFPPNTRAAVTASPLFFPNEIFRPHLLTHAL